MKDLYNKAVEFIRQNKAALFINACVCIICYGHLAFSQNVGIDTEHVINYPGVSMQWETIGRQGLLYTKRLFGVLNYNPYLGGVLFLGGFILLGSAAAFLCWMVSGENRHYPYGWFAVLFSTCPVWMMQFYFSLQRAEVVLGMLYGVISVYALCEILFFRQRQIYWFVLYFIFGVWCFASYQACVLLYISLCIICYLLDFIRDSHRNWIVYVKNVLGLIIGFALAYFSYTKIVGRFLANGWYLNGQVMWGKFPIKQNLALIIDHVKCMLNWYKPDYVSAYPLGCVCVFLLFCIYVKKRNHVMMLLLGLAGLMISPFLMSIYMGDKALTRTQFAQPVVSAAACMLFWGICNGLADKKLIWAKRISMLAALAIVWVSMSVIFRLEYTDDVRYREDVSTAEAIVSDLHQIPGAEGLPVIFVGEKKAEMNEAALAADMYGLSFFQWDYSDGNPTGATWRIIGFMNTLGIHLEDGSHYKNKAVAAAKEMACYPDSGYISVKKNYVVIKLSDVPDSK